MNCKPGDLAIVVDTCTGQFDTQPDESITKSKLSSVDMRGAVVKCIRSIFDAEDCSWGWEVEPCEVNYSGILYDGRVVASRAILTEVPDKILRPLRGGDLGEDVFTTDELPSDNLMLNTER